MKSARIYCMALPTLKKKRF